VTLEGQRGDNVSDIHFLLFEIIFLGLVEVKSFVGGGVRKSDAYYLNGPMMLKIWNKCFCKFSGKISAEHFDTVFLHVLASINNTVSIILITKLQLGI
jgi:hypothetical protein